MYGVKGKLSNAYFRDMGSFFFFSWDFVTQYFVDIFNEPPKKFVNE